eukprot:83008-Alexandrium_andersonii.AAC.1
MSASLVGSEMCIRDRTKVAPAESSRRGQESSTIGPVVRRYGHGAPISYHRRKGSCEIQPLPTLQIFESLRILLSKVPAV